MLIRIMFSYRGSRIPLMRKVIAGIKYQVMDTNIHCYDHYDYKVDGKSILRIDDDFFASRVCNFFVAFEGEAYLDEGGRCKKELELFEKQNHSIYKGAYVIDLQFQGSSGNVNSVYERLKECSSLDSENQAPIVFKNELPETTDNLKGSAFANAIIYKYPTSLGKALVEFWNKYLDELKKLTFVEGLMKCSYHFEVNNSDPEENKPNKIGELLQTSNDNKLLYSPVILGFPELTNWHSSRNKTAKRKRAATANKCRKEAGGVLFIVDDWNKDATLIESAEDLLGRANEFIKHIRDKRRMLFIGKSDDCFKIFKEAAAQTSINEKDTVEKNKIKFYALHYEASIRTLLYYSKSEKTWEYVDEELSTVTSEEIDEILKLKNYVNS